MIHISLLTIAVLVSIWSNVRLGGFLTMQQFYKRASSIDRVTKTLVSISALCFTLGFITWIMGK
jgi:hypothetical protein